MEQRRTPHRHLRVDNDLWKAFSDACDAAKTDRSTVLRAFMAWYSHRPKATTPKRPPAESLKPPTEAPS